MTAHETPFLVAEDRAGKPALAGRRRLVDGLDDAIEAAEEIGGTAFALEAIEKNPVPPIAAFGHVSLVEHGAGVLESNRAQSEYFDHVARRSGTAYPEAYPDPDDLGGDAA